VVRIVLKIEKRMLRSCASGTALGVLPLVLQVTVPRLMVLCTMSRATAGLENELHLLLGRVALCRAS